MIRALLIIAGCAGLYWSWHYFASIPPHTLTTPLAAHATASPPSSGPERRLDNVADSGLVTSAALFRPAVAPATADEVQPGRSFALIGFAGLGDNRVAILRDNADRQTLTARVGDNVRGWTLNALDRRCASLRAAGEVQELCL